MITGAQAIVKCLQQEGVETVFGYPGATILPLYDQLSGSGIQHVLTRTEQGAGHAASGYARMTGRPGVCITTSGPGATNLLTAVATAYSDSIPMVAVTGQVATHQLGRDVFQEIDTTGAAEPFTKNTYLVKSADELPRIFKEAFYIASTGRKGPVLIDVPVDVQQQMIAFAYPDQVSIRGYKPRYDGHPLQVNKVVKAINDARRPLICCGGGVFLSDARDGVRQLAERAGIPVVSTMMGISALPKDHNLYCGMLGQSGTKTANTALKENDLLVLIGARVGDRAITKPAHVESSTTIVHIDIDSAEIGKNIGTTIPLVGDAGRVVQQLLEKQPKAQSEEWISKLRQLRAQEQAALQARPAKPGFVDPNAFVRRLCESLPEESTYVADVGQNQIWSAKNYCAPGRFMTTGGMGTMGYSIPAAVGAKMARPGRLTLAVCGDGAFQMSMNELATMRQQNLPVKVVVMRNHILGMIREIQHNAYEDKIFSVDLSGSPDLSHIARAYGMEFMRIDSMEEASAAIEKILQADQAFLLECIVDPKEETK